MEGEDYHHAIDCYTKGLSPTAPRSKPLGPIALDLHRSRAQAHLHLEHFEDAYRDCVTILVNNPWDEEALYTKCCSLYGLGNFTLCKTVLLDLIEFYPRLVAGRNLKSETERRLDKQNTGNYDFDSLFQRMKKGERKLDLASFTNRTEVRDAGRAGRGLFANVNIEVDDLVLCEKPFVISPVEEYNNRKVSCVIGLVGNYHTIMSWLSFPVKCIQKARVDKKGARELMKLHDEGYPNTN